MNGRCKEEEGGRFLQVLQLASEEQEGQEEGRVWVSVKKTSKATLHTSNI